MGLLQKPKTTKSLCQNNKKQSYPRHIFRLFIEQHFQLCNKAFSGYALTSCISYPGYTLMSSSLTSCISHPSEEKHWNSQAEETSLPYVLNTDVKVTHQVSHSASSISQHLMLQRRKSVHKDIGICMSWENSSDLCRVNTGNTETFFCTSRTDLCPNNQNGNQILSKRFPNLILLSD